MRAFQFGFLLMMATLMPHSLRADTINIGGSGGGLVLFDILGASFAKHDPSGRIEIIPSLGSAGGISAVAAGVIDVAISWRKLNAKETLLPVMEAEILETPYVFDTTHPKIGTIRTDDLPKIHSGDVAAWPDGSPLRLILRPKSDANSIYVTKNIPGMPEAFEKVLRRRDIPSAAPDTDNIALADKIDGVLAGMSLLQLRSSDHSRLRALALNEIQPSISSMRDGSYPYVLQMHLMVSRTPSPLVERFLKYLKGSEAESIINQFGAVRKLLAFSNPYRKILTCEQ